MTVGVLLRAELLHFLRDRRALGFGICVLVLIALAAAEGASRAQSARADRAAAEAIDHEVWVEQGPNNPHGAAHFARYAFRPVSALAAFDPGLADYGGAAVWMEAHNQNPATLRRSEELGSTAPWPSIDAAFSLRVLGGLFLTVLLFGAVAGEREQGTLRALAAQGVDARSLLLGKVFAAAVPVAGFGVLILIAIVGAETVIQSAPLEIGRVLLMAAAYCLGLGAFALVVLALSARAMTRGAALAAGGTAWVVLALFLPAVAGSVAAALHPTPTPRDFAARIQDEAQTPFWVGDAREGAIADYEASVLASYGGESIEALGFDRAGLELQAHEEFANVVYDRIYGDLDAIHAAQERTVSWISLLSPLHVLQRLSAGIAGTDLLAQREFVRDAEAHRRVIIAQLNRDMMEQAGGEGFSYAAGRELWEATPDFVATPPTLGETLLYYQREWIGLLLWSLIALLAAHAGFRSALREVRAA